MISSVALQTANTVLIAILLFISFMVTLILWVTTLDYTSRKSLTRNSIATFITLLLFYVFLLLMLR